MLRLNDLVKVYYLGKNIEKVQALKGISVSFRKNEFVSILGPSGCGKTTLLNIIGGLDKYTSGDLFINGKSTKDFSDRDWDVYRNHRIGFIFQSYNLIPHQTVLGNVELALNIAGIPKDKRIEMAKNAIDRVGLEGLYNKKPNQLSGGQCQRVAIARALVNDPEILLADEPTGALDTKTSIQIMELIKEIAKDRLVIMVTHNPDLAKQYSTRIVNLLDGKIVDDSNPYDESEEIQSTKNQIVDDVEIEKEKAKMKVTDAFRLSFKNLISKKGRTTMTAIAGSIGIVGVSLVLALSSGITGYVDNMQNDMLSGNPITISTNAYDINGLLNASSTEEKIEILKEEGYINVNSIIERLMKTQDSFFSFQIKNEIDELYIAYLSGMSPDDVAAITYDYGFEMPGSIFTDMQVRDVDSPEYMSINTIIDTYQSVLKTTEYGIYSSYVTSLTDVFGLLPDNEEYLMTQYDVKYGKIATKADEIMIVINNDYQLSDLTLAELGYFTEEEFLNISYRASNSANYNPDKDVTKLSYDEILSKKFVFYPNDEIYSKNETTNIYTYNAYRNNLDGGLELKIVGILSPKDGINYGCLETGVYYTSALNEYAIEVNKNSQIVTDLNNAIEYEKAHPLTIDGQIDPVNYPQIIKYADAYYFVNIPYYLHYYYVDSETNEFTKIDNDLTYINSDSSLSSFTSSSFATVGAEYIGASTIPAKTSIYPVDFDAKNRILEYLDKWNEEGTITVNGTDYTLSQRNEIKYVDNLSLIISMLKDLIAIVTAALVAFTALSLVVSTVMIGIITYVSVVERTKEIGVIRSLGGRKRDVSNLFVAETFILGLFSGVAGVTITYLVSIIINVIIKTMFGIYPIAALPVSQALMMIGISILLTLISGVMPARAAAKRDPVIALRTE